MKNPRTWYEIKAKKADTAEILIYEQIGEDFWGEGVSAKRFVEDLQALDVATIELHINSPGGNVFDGNAMYNALRAHKAKVLVTVDGVAASVASVVAMAGDTITMPENAMMMIHDPWWFAVGTAEDMMSAAETLEKLKGSLISSYRAKTGQDAERISELMSAETWLTAAEAVDLGFCDETTDRVNAQANFQSLSRYRNVPKNLIAGPSGKISTKEGQTMPKDQNSGPEITLESLRAQYPAIVNTLIDEGKRLGMEEGANQERSRIQAVQEQLIPGHEDLINSLMWDGKTTGEQAAVQVLAAEKRIRDKTVQDLKDDAPDPAKHTIAPETEPGKDNKGFLELVEDYQREHQCKKSVAIKAIARLHSKEHQAYLDEINK